MGFFVTMFVVALVLAIAVALIGMLFPDVAKWLAKIGLVIAILWVIAAILAMMGMPQLFLVMLEISASISSVLAGGGAVSFASAEAALLYMGAASWMQAGMAMIFLQVAVTAIGFALDSETYSEASAEATEAFTDAAGSITEAVGGAAGGAIAGGLSGLAGGLFGGASGIGLGGAVLLGVAAWWLLSDSGDQDEGKTVIYNGDDPHQPDVNNSNKEIAYA